mmetsp:Transcript_30096/g.86164  ORF Transcript_30096/g.86164 Transcript_30096/m.86164 type:complete len:288 (+) Transcript_30096:3-866(+)
MRDPPRQHQPLQHLQQQQQQQRRCLRRAPVAASRLAALLASVAALLARRPASFLAGFRPGAVAPERPSLLVRFARGGEGRSVDGAVEPLGSHLLVRLGLAEKTTQGGIVLPSRRRPSEGDVVSIGPGEVRGEGADAAVTPVGVAAGRRVMYSKYASFTPFELEGVEHALIREDDLVASFDSSAPRPLKAADLSAPRGRALVRLDESKRETEGGLLLSKGAAAEGSGGATTLGVVVAVGPSDVDGEDPELAIGDRVYFKYGEEVQLSSSDKEKYMAVRFRNCIAKVLA